MKVLARFVNFDCVATKFYDIENRYKEYAAMSFKLQFTVGRDGGPQKVLPD